MSVQLKAEIDNALQCLTETYSLALEFGESKDLDMFLSCAAKLLTVRENDRRMNEAIKIASEQGTVDDFDSVLQSELETLQSQDFCPKRTKEFEDFKRQLIQMGQAADGNQAPGSTTTRIESDDFVMESEINVFDPLTKQRMQNPVRNTLCNHHYEKSTIFEAISINRRLRCPVAGCGNKNFVTKSSLVDDNMFKIRLQRMQEAEIDV